MQIFHHLLRRSPANATFDLFSRNSSLDATLGQVEPIIGDTQTTQTRLRGFDAAAIRTAIRGLALLGALFVVASAALWGQTIAVRTPSLTITLPPARMALGRAAADGRAPNLAASTLRAVRLGPSFGQREQSVNAVLKTLDGVPQAPMALRRSRYTSLEPTSCTMVNQDADKAHQPFRRCAGVDGYALETGGAGRAPRLAILTPDGQRAELDVARIAADGLPGSLAEWRAGGNGQLRALIVRLSVPGNRSESSLIVAKLAGIPCIVAVIPRGTSQNERARAVADRKQFKCATG